MRVHANDGLSASAKTSLAEQDFIVTTDHVPQEALVDYLNKEKVDVLLVRSATKVRRDLIDACPGLKLIGRGGVGLDNIDVAYAKQKGIPVINTPASSSISVAELVMAHLFGLMRNLHESNRTMPVDGNIERVVSRLYAVEEALPVSAVGVVYHDTGEIAGLVRDLVDHHGHYLATARAFARAWQSYHNSDRLIGEIAG